MYNQQGTPVMTKAKSSTSVQTHVVKTTAAVAIGATAPVTNATLAANGNPATSPVQLPTIQLGGIPGVVVARRYMNKNYTMAAGKDLLRSLAGRRVMIGVSGSGVFDEVTISEYNYKKCGKKIYALRTCKRAGQRYTDIKPGSQVDIVVIG